MSRERKSKVTTEIAERVTASLRAGADWALAARLAGVCKQTLRTYMQAHPQIAEEWEAARSEADDLIVKSLFDRASKGDTTAMIFWLKNRRPGEWRDKPENLINLVFASPVWRQIEDAIVVALEAYPDAKGSVVKALEEVKPKSE